MLLAKFRNIDGYENMFRKQLESILSTSQTSKPTPKPVVKPTPKEPISARRMKKATPTPRPKKQMLYDLQMKKD